MASFTKKWVAGASAVAMLLSGAAAAKDEKESASKILDQLEECPGIADPTQRLACFDSRYAVLREARKKDRNFLVRAARTEFKPIEAVAVAVTELQPGTWLMVLSDHSVWRTNDEVRFIPEKGQKVSIGKAALGSFVARIGTQHAVRVKPLQ